MHNFRTTQHRTSRSATYPTLKPHEVAEVRAEVEESGSDIRVTISLAGVDSGLDCQDSVKVELASPLDGRRVIDAVNGQPVPVQPAE